jgi:hypothetical protein
VDSDFRRYIRDADDRLELEFERLFFMHIVINK